MNSPTVYHLVSVKKNLAITAPKSGQSSAGCVLEKQCDGENQKWAIEYSDDANKVAVRSMATNEYLRVNPETDSITTGDKYIWRAWDGDDPLIYRSGQLQALSIHDKAMFLEGGGSGDHLSLYRNIENDGRQPAEFYFKSTAVDTTEKRIFGYDRAQAAEQEKTMKEMQDRRDKLAQREKELAAEWERKLKEVQDRQDVLAKAEQDRAASFDAKVKALEDREAALAQKDSDRSAELDKMMGDLKSQRESSTQAGEERAASVEHKSRDLQARELRLAEREQEAEAHLAGHHKSDEDDRNTQARQGVDLQRKIDALEATERSVATDRAALHKSKADFAAQEIDLQQGRRELEDQRSAAERDLSVARIALEQEREEFESQKSSAKACTREHVSDGQDDSWSETVAGKKQLENVKLEQRLIKLERKLALMSTPSPVRMEESMTNGSGKGRAANGVGGASGCGHKHYKPPRKLNRKLIGMIYE